MNLDHSGEREGHGFPPLVQQMARGRRRPLPQPKRSTSRNARLGTVAGEGSPVTRTVALRLPATENLPFKRRHP